MKRRDEDSFLIRAVLLYRMWRQMGYGRLRACVVAFNLASL